MEKEELFKSVFYRMCNADINLFMQTYTETNVAMYPYNAKVLGNLLIRLCNEGYDVHLTCEPNKDDVIVVKYTNDNTAHIYGFTDDNCDEWDSVLDWDNIYGILQSNEDAMKFVLENTETEIPDEDLDTLYWFENRGATHKFYEDAIQSLDVAIKELRECAEILHNLKF